MNLHDFFTDVLLIIWRMRQQYTPGPLACIEASKKGDLIATQFLIENCTVLVTNKNGDNYLHAACESGSLDVVKLIVEKYSGMDLSTCSILGGNSEGNSPLHTASLTGSLDIVLYLIQNASCDIYSFDNKQQTPLYCALMNIHEELVMKMLSLDIFDPKRDYMKGQPLLHCVLKAVLFRCSFNLFGLLQSLIRNNICNINQCNVSGNSILHSAVLFSTTSAKEFEYGLHPFFLKVWEFLLSTDGISIINHPNENGDTPLHLICRFIGSFLRIHSKCDYICKMLLNYGNSTVTPSLSHKNKNGKTPIQVAPYSLYRLLISYGANPNDVYEEFSAVLNKYKTEQPLDPRMKIIVLGNSTAGKTTLIEALKADENSDRDIIQVNGPTVGMTTSLHQSEALGQVKFHDFAGQPEYESNNSAFLKASLCSTSLAQAPIFILTVDASKRPSMEKVLKYWLSFIKNHSPAKLEPPPHLITVASHIDLIPSSEHPMILKTIATAMNGVQSSRFKMFGPIPIDCRRLRSTAMESLTKLLSESCSSLRRCIELDCRCHILFTRLIEWFPNIPAVKFGDIQKRIKKEAETSKRQRLIKTRSRTSYSQISHDQDILLPFTTDTLLPLIESLHSGSHLTLLKGQEHTEVEDYWIVMDHHSLFEKVNGTLFAPDDFHIHPTLQTNIGVVSSNMLAPLFEDIDITLATKFLEYSEFCQKIVDKHTLQLIDASLCDISDDVVNTKSMSLRQPTDPTCLYYFFPAFIKSDRPNQVWDTPDCMGLSYYSCGWYLQCQQDHFLESRFLQVLLLRLTFSFAAASAPSDSSNDQYLFRKCNIWKNGIHWSSRTGVEMLVEVVEQTSAVLMLCRSFEGKEMEAVKLRSAVLKKILDTKEEFCPSTETEEYLLHPSALKCSGYPDISKPDAKIHISEVAQAVSNGEPCIIDSNQHPIPLEQILHFDPYLLIGKDSILSLWSEDLSDQELTDDFFMRLSSQLSKFINQVARVLSVSSEEVLHLSQEWRESPRILLLQIFESWKSKTDHAFYKKLREEFGCHSIFCGRNPLTLIINTASQSRVRINGSSRAGKCALSSLAHHSGSDQSNLKPLKHGQLEPPLSAETEMETVLNETDDIEGICISRSEVMSVSSPRMLHKRDIRGYCSSSTHDESGNRVYELSTQQSDMEMSDLVESDDQSLGKPSSIHLNQIIWIPHQDPRNKTEKKLALIQRIASSWRKVAGVLGIEQSRIDIIATSYSTIAPERCMGDVLTMWVDNAVCLPRAKRYPLTWKGLYQLLKDSEFGEVAQELKRALSSKFNSVRGNLSEYRTHLHHETVSEADLCPSSPKLARTGLSLLTEKLDDGSGAVVQPKED